MMWLIKSLFQSVLCELWPLSYNININTCSGSRNNKTFKPKKNIPEGTHQYDLMKHAAVTLGSGNLRLAVMLPEGEDVNEWVAVNSKFKHARALHIHIYMLIIIMYTEYNRLILLVFNISPAEHWGCLTFPWLNTGDHLLLVFNIFPAEHWGSPIGGV